MKENLIIICSIILLGIGFYFDKMQEPKNQKLVEHYKLLEKCQNGYVSHLCNNLN